MNYLYLVLDLGALLSTLLFSFYSDAPFYKTWKYLWISIFVTGLIFLVWDEWFIRQGVWGFNREYLSGIYVGSLPLEEILFFVCIPYACVFTYEALNYLIKEDRLERGHKFVSIFLILLLSIVGIWYWERIYTSVTFLTTSALLTCITFVWKPNFMGRFYLSFVVILLPFFIVNGILTGTWIEEEVVWYNNSENLSVRIGTVPIEDFVYALLLILSNISLLEIQRSRIRVPSTGNKSTPAGNLLNG